MIESTATTLYEERSTITHGWVSAQVRANFYAGFGLSVQIAVPGVIFGAMAELVGLPRWGVISYAYAVAGCAGIGLVYFGWLTFVRFSIDEWIVNGQRDELQRELAKLQQKEAAYEAARTEIIDLRKQNDDLRWRLNSRPKVNATPAEKAEPKQMAHELPQNIKDAYVIVQQWFLDPLPDHPNVSKVALEGHGIPADRQREAWAVLQSLDVAGREDSRPNAKRIVTCQDESEINNKLHRYIANINRSDGSYVMNK
jgi:hypothetical protein